ncbi:hypothetical protein B0H11DRAFT_2188336 [Mycena galericulata]|nr:hypothetical protein B0H11DRAFT_2188336 [Mycena galericulata]
MRALNDGDDSGPRGVHGDWRNGGDGLRMVRTQSLRAQSAFPGPSFTNNTPESFKRSYSRPPGSLPLGRPKLFPNYKCVFKSVEKMCFGLYAGETINKFAAL